VPSRIIPGKLVSPGISLTDQLTATFVVPSIVGIKGCENPAFKVLLVGEILRVTGAVVMVTTADDKAEGLLMLVAVTVAVPPVGRETGAV
jgi:hypothetical protein